jgi:hypothetical protein
MESQYTEQGGEGARGAIGNVEEDAPVDRSDDDEEEITDTIGLERAYASPSKLYRHRGVLYIAGTSSVGDVMEWPDIPLHKVPQTTRYKTAKRYLDSDDGQGITRLVGHSLGGSVALEISKNYNISNATTYGAPVVDLIPRNPWHKPDRIACKGDPVAILDLGAKKVNCLDRLNQHSYRGLERFRGFSSLNPGNIALPVF